MADITANIKKGNEITANVRSDTPVTVNMGEVIGQKEIFKIDTFTGDNTTTVFPTTVKFRANSLAVWLNGVLQQRGTSYTDADARTFITFTTAPKTGWKGEMRYVQD